MQVADKKHESSEKAPISKAHGPSRPIIFRAIREYLNSILSGLHDYHHDSSKAEVLDEALRLTRTAKCAASMAGAWTSNQILSYQEEILEPIARKSSELDDDTLALLTTMILAMESLAALSEYCDGNGNEASAGACQQLVKAVKAYRRFRQLPDKYDEAVISKLLSACSPVGTSDAVNGSGSSHETQELSPDSISPELLAIFTEEAEDHISNMYDGLNRLREDSGDRELVQQVRRSAHTLKGAAAAVGLTQLTRLSHRMEDLLDQLYASSHPLTTETVGLLLSTTDVLHDMGTDQAGSQRRETELGRLYGEYDKHCGVEGPAISYDVGKVDEGSHSSRSTDTVASNADSAGRPSDAHSEKTSEVIQPVQWLRVPAARLDDLRHVVSELMINRTAFEQNVRNFARCAESFQPVIEQLRAVCRDMESWHELPGLSAPAPVPTGQIGLTSIGRAPANAVLDDFDELEFDTYTGLDSLSLLCAEATNGVSTLSQRMRALSDEFDSLLALQDRLTRGAQARLLQIRMVPFGTVTQRLRRVLREVSVNQDKAVELVIEGEETELDKIVLEEMADPLLHLLRNAVDHGVERTEERQAQGKPATAKIQIDVAHHGTQVVIRIRDDGKGIDVEKIRQAIVTRFDVDAQRAETLTPEELYPYIFAPGLSTASHISEISGRGVGMDIVRSRIEKLKGRIDVRSCSGQGTTLTIRLPVTLAVTSALIVEAGEEIFAVPMQGIAKIAKVSRDSTDPSEREPRVNVEGVALPLAYLPDHLGLPRNPVWPTRTLTLIVVASADRLVAVAVDKIRQRRDIVVKSLGDHLGHVPGLIGATVLGDGSVVPILDPADLATHPRMLDAPVPTRQQCSTNRDGSLLVMVVDDSVSIRHVTSNLVQRAGWKSVAAKDGVDALELLDRLPKPPDVFLLDVEMPRMDGYQLLSALREKPEFAQKPIIMITSRAGAKHRQTAFRLGATQFVAKPVQEEELVAMIRGLTT